MVLLCVSGLIAPFGSSVARADNGLFGSRSWTGDSGYEASIGNDDEVPWFTLRINALYLNREGPQSNPVLTETATGNTLLNTSQNDPSWAGGTEVNFLFDISETTNFEFDWFSVDDWFDRHSTNYAPTIVDEAPFPVTLASVSVSSRIRNMEFNLREEVYDNFTLIGGFRYIEFLDSQGIHYQNQTTLASEVISTNVANRLYGVQIGGQFDFLKTESWEVSGWAKVGIYGNGASNSTGIFSTVPGDAQNIRAQDGKTAFAGDMGLRGSYHFGKHISIFCGYRLMYLDGIAKAANQYTGTVNYLETGIPSIQMRNSILFQGLEGGLTFRF